MALKLRLARHGAKKRPFYWIMAADSRKPRETGKEKLGTYNPLLSKTDPLRVQLNQERIAHWLSCGAQPTETVRRFLEKAGIIKPTIKPYQKLAAKANSVESDKASDKKTA
jgi:small subunit ribosomal protein S16